MRVDVDAASVGGGLATSLPEVPLLRHGCRGHTVGDHVIVSTAKPAAAALGGERARLSVARGRALVALVSAADGAVGT